MSNTSETITYEQIWELVNSFGEFDPARDACLQAINGATEILRQNGRARCAEILNSRPKPAVVKLDWEYRWPSCNVPMCGESGLCEGCRRRGAR